MEKYKQNLTKRGPVHMVRIILETQGYETTCEIIKNFTVLTHPSTPDRPRISLGCAIKVDFDPARGRKTPKYAISRILDAFRHIKHIHTNLLGSHNSTIILLHTDLTFTFQLVVKKIKIFNHSSSDLTKNHFL